jgi:hypothetical protein
LVQVDVFHILIVLSFDPEARYFPFGENTTEVTPAECPVRLLSSPSGMTGSAVATWKKGNIGKSNIGASKRSAPR